MTQRQVVYYVPTFMVFSRARSRFCTELLVSFVQLAGAFECYADHVTTVKEQRKRVESTLSMWTHPGLRRCMQGWLEYMDIVAEERMEAGREAIRKQMHEMAEQMQAEGVRGQELVQSEADRRIETCKRTIKRMQQHHPLP